uniref:type I restriction enzyme HsdR N-terminal domain-containing protein n=1 Tax=Crenothrix polyspora TaxID=360316 RepID=UPI00117862E9
MNSLDLNSNTLLLNKKLSSLSEPDLVELKRIEGLDVTNFSEQDVREEIINQLLRILGYKKNQDYSVDREKHIRFLGKTNRYIDYNLTLWEKNFWIIEAKKPIKKANSNKSHFTYKELSQVVEYAIHPDINAALVVLCDGVEIEVFDREQNVEEPLLRVSIKNLSKEFDKLRNLLCPLHVWFFYKRRVI